MSTCHQSGRTQSVSWMGRFLLLCLLLVAGKVVSFSSSAGGSSSTERSSTTTVELSAAIESKTEGVVHVSTSVFSASDWLRSTKKPKVKCGPCPNNEEEPVQDALLLELVSPHEDSTMHLAAHSNKNKNKDLDRREAAFAMVGALWATTSTLFPAAPARAVYGAEPNIELPNMVESMAQRNNGQCLVESLGSRQCLVYMDPDNKLYQGADSQKLLHKMERASLSLTKIPELVSAKKWSGVKSILTGPMGELLTTMNLLATLSTQEVDLSMALAKQVKLQLFAISAAADQKDGSAILTSHDAATHALVAFVQSL